MIIMTNNCLSKNCKFHDPKVYELACVHQFSHIYGNALLRKESDADKTTIQLC